MKAADEFKAADPAVELRWHADHKLPCRFIFGEVAIDVLTKRKSGNKSPVEIKALGVAGEALPFQAYLTEQAFEAIALHGAGVRVRIPEPARYATHKLIIANRRGDKDPKQAKDLEQARAIFDALDHFGNEHEIEDAVESARERGRSWKSAINKSLAVIGRDV